MAVSAADYRSALELAVQQFADWRAAGRLTEQQLGAVTRHYEQRLSVVDPHRDYSGDFPTNEEVESTPAKFRPRARWLRFMLREVRRHVASELLTAGPAQLCLADLEAELATIEDRLAGGDESPAAEPPGESTTGRPLIELLLDPRSLQALMACGAGLLVLGLVIWLTVIGVFENPLVVAATVGVANLAALAAGVAAVLHTRYQTAGRAVTLLACLVLPLNLWLYDAQGLITVADGNLWLPALVICGLYAGTARLLKDPTFVYALVGGVTMTGLLFLADGQVERLWEVVAPSTLLVAIGVACVHAERLFAPGEGPFSRERFGRAFFNSGHFVMATGLAVLLCGRLVGWFYEPFFAELGWFVRPDVATASSAKLIALLLAGVASYTYVYSQLAVARGGRYAYSALLTLLWCEVIAIDLLPLEMTASLFTLVLASTALAATAASAAALRLAGRVGEAAVGQANRLAVVASRVGAALVAAALGLGAALFVIDAFDLTAALDFRLDGVYVAAMSLVAAAGWFGGAQFAKLGRDRLAEFSRHAATLAGLMTIGGGLALVGLPQLAATLPLMGAAPLLMLAAARATSEASRQASLRRSAQVGAAGLLAMAIPAALGFAPMADGWVEANSPLLMGLFFAETAVVFGAVASRREEDASPRFAAPMLAAVSGWAAAWQWLLFFGFTTYAPVLAPSVVGLACIAAGRLLNARGPDEERPAGRGLSTIGGTMAVVGSVAGMLLTGNRLIADALEWQLVGLMFAQAAATALAGLLTKGRDLRRTLLILAGGNLVGGLVVLSQVAGLSFGQRVEVFLTAVGALMLGAGHLGWRKESSRRSGMVSFNLAVGSLLSAAPMACGLLAQRVGGDSAGWGWVLFHEVGVLSTGLLLLAIGVMCRIRWTTVVGGGTVATYLASLVMLIHLPDKLQSASVYMMVGGATFFAVAVLLSVYRDHLLKLPQRVRDGEGVFTVLQWR